MKLEVITYLLRLTWIDSSDVINAIYKAQTCEDIYEVVRIAWTNPSRWHKRIRGLEEVATITERDWKNILQAAKTKCEELGGDFKDPTGTWSF